MTANGVFKIGLLSMIAATGLFAASNGLAADEDTTGDSALVNAEAVSDDLTSPGALTPQWQVVDPNGNVYFLTSLKTKEDKVTVGYAHPYTNPTSH